MHVGQHLNQMILFKLASCMRKNEITGDIFLNGQLNGHLNVEMKVLSSLCFSVFTGIFEQAARLRNHASHENK